MVIRHKWQVVCVNAVNQSYFYPAKTNRAREEASRRKLGFTMRLFFCGGVQCSQEPQDSGRTSLGHKWFVGPGVSSDLLEQWVCPVNQQGAGWGCVWSLGPAPLVWEGSGPVTVGLDALSQLPSREDRCRRWCLRNPSSGSAQSSTHTHSLKYVPFVMHFHCL